jgi:hypothetical protein
LVLLIEALRTSNQAQFLEFTIDRSIHAYGAEVQQALRLGYPNARALAALGLSSFNISTI